MTDLLAQQTRGRADRLTILIFIAITAALTGVRLAGLGLSQAELFVDEAQYWLWAQTPAWGYFSKPPLLAWLIALAQGVCGSGEACVRAPSTLSWAATALLVFALGWGLAPPERRRAVALLAGFGALLAPGAVFSARIASTDAPLLAFWALALLALARLRAGGGRGWLWVLAAAFGLGLLTKYAMAYLPLCLAAAALVDAGARRLAGRVGVWLALAAGALFLGPNLGWNLDNEAATLRHTVENAAGDGLRLDLVGAAEFVAAQFGVAGPVAFAALFVALFRWRRLSGEARFAAAFAAPIFLILTGLAATRGANANWAATGVVALFVLAPLVLDGRAGRRWLVGGLILGAAIQALLLVADARAERLSLAGRAPYARVLGWRDLAHEVDAVARDQGTRTIVAESRADAAALTYYLRAAPRDVRAWPAPHGGAARHHYQQSRALAGGARTGPVLAVSACPLARFPGWSTARALGEVTAATGPGAARTRHLWRLDGAPVTIQAPVCDDET